MSNILKRTTLIVRDMKVARRWYEHVFGMKTWMDDTVTLTGKGIPAGNAGDKTHLVIMQGEDPMIGMIGLLHWIEPALPAPEEIPTRVTYGNPTMVVASDDAKGVHDRAVELGTHIHSAPREWSIRGQDGNMKHMIGLALFDPDGYFYEVNQVVKPT